MYRTATDKGDSLIARRSRAPAGAGSVRAPSRPAHARPASTLSSDLRAEAERERPQLQGHIDGPLTMLTLLLLLVGLVCLFSASYAVAYDSENGNSMFYIFRQGIFAAAGVAVMFILSKVNYHKLHYLAIPALICAVLLMATIKVPGLKSLWVTRNEATRWINLFGIQFQPSELAKVAVILSFSSIATIFGEKKMHTLRWGIMPFIVMIGLFAVLMKWEKHLSGTVIIALIGMLIIFIGGANMGWLAAGAGAGLTGVIWYIKTNEYAMNRINVWLHPFDFFHQGGWQGSNSMIAIGSGGFWGLGLGQSRQKHLYLPEPANDFIFSVVCEELGFIGAVLILLIFAALIWRGYYIALHANDKFGTLLAAGITTQIAVQVVINLFVVTGLCPVTGAALPFFSYGGTALLIQLAEMGILLAISRRMPAPKEG